MLNAGQHRYEDNVIDVPLQQGPSDEERNMSRRLQILARQIRKYVLIPTASNS